MQNLPELQSLPEFLTITRAYPSFEDARNVVVRLVEAGIPPDRIGLLGHQTGGDDNAAAGAGVGGAAGAATGFVMALGSLTLPGLGPIVAAGWFLSGAVAGALAGGVIGALIDAGLPAEEAEARAAEHRLGESVLSVRAAGSEIERAMTIMDAALPIRREHGDTELPAALEPDEPHGRADDLSKAVS
ncbi:hypothetical protein [Bosea vaviloviae]|uniref:DUF1269 domain-containing protein n=1 Tax=Bosea vaviloviae TaxID=1526658 RepID=A0A1D7U1T6_9HYPH|nr:hypothetical protein [Bosea vaviloviae]AOO81332.1 hypothetical protein BHK69_13430 [Bosea vaviloviae]